MISYSTQLKFLKEILSNVVWFFDYDGSLCPHQELWDEHSYDSNRILKALRKMARTSQGVYWNTGRQIHSLAAVNSEFLDFSGFFVHGNFFWNAVDSQKTQLAVPFPDSLTEMVKEWIEPYPEFKLEVKPTALRLTPTKKDCREKLSKAFASLKGRVSHPWFVYDGPRAVEILNIEFNKGTAVQQALLNNHANRNPIPVAVGDDEMDKFAVQACLKFGGYGILVGENCGWITEIPHNPKQVIYFDTPEAVLELLEGL
jgi:trehalose-phosphatase